MDESHEAFISDNDSRETYETWEACLAEGVRTRKVEKEMPDLVQQLHEDSLTEGRDILKDADEDEKKKWLSKSGTDWSGAFGQDPKAYVDSNGKKAREPGADEPLHDPHHPSSDEYSDDNDESTSDSDLGVQDAKSAGNTQSMDGGSRNGASLETSRTNGSSNYGDPNKANKRTEQRKQRGMMQWKPARNAKFAADQSKLGLRKLKSRLTGGLDGRQPGVETETGA